MHETRCDIIRIAITGPESTGKSLLAKALAEHYRTAWVPEYARKYLEEIKRPYTKADILEIARGQLASEQKQISRAAKFLFCDTEAIVTKIWSTVKYGDCDPWIEAQITRSHYGLYLLCDIDLPWEEDPLREHPDKREFLFRLYQNELQSHKLPCRIVSGLGRARLEKAIKIIDKAF